MTYASCVEIKLVYHGVVIIRLIVRWLVESMSTQWNRRIRQLLSLVTRRIRKIPVFTRLVFVQAQKSNVDDLIQFLNWFLALLCSTLSSIWYLIEKWRSIRSSWSIKLGEPFSCLVSLMVQDAVTGQWSTKCVWPVTSERSIGLDLTREFTGFGKMD